MVATRCWGVPLTLPLLLPLLPQLEAAVSAAFQLGLSYPAQATARSTPVSCRSN